MTEEPENHTLHLLREMREEIKAGFGAVNEHLERLEGKVDRLEAESATQSALLGKVMDGQREGQREVNERLGRLEGAVSGLQADVKALPDALGAGRVDAGISKADFEALREVQQTHWIRLNAIDDRLALIEKHTGIVKA